VRKAYTRRTQYGISYRARANARRRDARAARRDASTPTAMAATAATTTTSMNATSARSSARATRARRADKTTARARRRDDDGDDDGRAATTTTRAACAAIAAMAMACSSARAYVPGFFAASAEASETTTTSFAGRYADPKHPGCLREISADGTVRGEDGDPGCGKTTRTRPWTLSGVIDVNDDSIFIDFSPKGGPANLLGERVEGGVKFPDGNVWRKLE
jgi:hypothetical protein